VRMMRWGPVWLVAAIMLLAGCTGSAPTMESEESLPVSALTGGSLTGSPLPTPTGESEESLPLSPLTGIALTGSPLPTPSAAATTLAEPVRLIVLHTNDNWGETEPCG
jgi:hypothetical protein